MSHEEVAQRIGDKTLLVVDVRGRDFKGGNIPNVKHMRTSSVVDEPGDLLDLCRRDGVKDMVFTCMYSKLRAVKCATAVVKYMHKRRRRDPSISADDDPTASILTEGMHGWVNHWHKTPRFSELVVNFDESVWEECKSHDAKQTAVYGLVHNMDAVWSEGGKKELALALEDALRERITQGDSDVSTADDEEEIEGDPHQDMEACLDMPTEMLPRLSIPEDAPLIDE
jgi:hypothetical protein